MAFRGRGRGRGGGRGAFFDTRIGKHVPYDEFPEDVTLPCLTKSIPKEVLELIRSKQDLMRFWKSSCYYLEETSEKPKIEDKDIERFSGRSEPKAEARRESLSFYLKLTTLNFPSELVQGSKRVRHDYKKLRWDSNSGEKMSDWFKKQEEDEKNEDAKKDPKDKKGDGDEEDEEDEEQELGDSDDDDDDDYCQNKDFDDDEDDLNMEEEPDEDAY